MQYVEFGTTGLRVSPVALGTGQLGARTDGSIDTDEAKAVLEKYIEPGGNFIDTSEAYQGGRSEELIGEVLGDRRDDMIIASKYTRSTMRAPSPGRSGGHRKAMVQSIEGSLRRLRTDRIDLYFAHFDDGITPVEEIMRGFDDLVTAGKILYAGLSNFPAWRAARAAAIADVRGWVPLSCVQIEYNLLQRTPEREILPLARAERLGVLAYSPLAAGALATQQSSRAPSRVGLESEANVEEVFKALSMIASARGSDVAKAAVSWVIAKGAIPVLGARNLEHLSGTLPALDLVLAADEIKQLDAATEIRLGYPHELLAAFQRRQQ